MDSDNVSWGGSRLLTAKPVLQPDLRLFGIGRAKDGLTMVTLDHLGSTGLSIQVTP